MVTRSYARLIVRQIADLSLRRARAWQEMLEIDRTDATVLAVILSANLAHLPLFDRASGCWAGLGVADDRRRAVRLHGLARSMGLAYQSGRRRAGSLAERGLIRATGGTFLVPVELFDSAAGRDLWRVDAEGVRKLIALLAELGNRPSVALRAAGIETISDDVLARARLDFTVRVMASLTELHGDVTNGAILVAIIAANIRHLIDDKAYARRYSAIGAIPPDSDRVPITTARLAEEMALPAETVRRRVKGMIDRGLVDSVIGGVVVPTRVLGSQAQHDNTEFVATQFVRMLVQLRQAVEEAHA